MLEARMIQYFDESVKDTEQKTRILPFNLDKLAHIANLINLKDESEKKDILELSKIETLRKEDLEKLSYLIAFNSPVYIEIKELITLLMQNLPSNIFEIQNKFNDYATPLLAVSELYLKKIEYFLNVSLKNPILYKTRTQTKIKEILMALEKYNTQMEEVIKQIHSIYMPKNKIKASKDSHAFYQKMSDIYIKKIEEQISNNIAFQVFLTKKNYLIHSTMVKTYDYLKSPRTYVNEQELDNYLEDVDIEYANLTQNGKHNLKLFLITEQEFVINDTLITKEKSEKNNIIKFPQAS
jgi:hypothetical protein